MKWRPVFLLAAATTVGLANIGIGDEVPFDTYVDATRWIQGDFAEAKRIAKREGKPIFALFR